MNSAGCPGRHFGRFGALLLAALLLGAALLPCVAAARDITQAESDRAFKIFLNVKEELLQRCIYRPTDLDVLNGMLKALENELDPEFAPYFPQQLPRDFQKAFDLAQKSLRKLAAQPELESRTLQSLVEQGLRTYCRQLDRYSDYDTLAAYEMEVKLRAPSYVGIGMTIERNAEGFDLYPFPSGPADLAGCFPGDRLLEVNGTSVRGLGRIEAGALFFGPVGSELKMKVRRALGGKDEVITMRRAKIDPASIAVEQLPGGTVVRLRRLIGATLEELRSLLRTVKPGTPLTLDLRGCPGGELLPAIAIAELFLPAKEKICDVETRAGIEHFVSRNPTPFVAKPLTILQNRGTMSGAELIIVALVNSPTVRATSRGERSYGKGVTLSVVLVEDGGGQIRYAEGRMFGPHGEFWDRDGVAPTIEDSSLP